MFVPDDDSKNPEIKPLTVENISALQPGDILLAAWTVRRVSADGQFACVALSDATFDSWVLLSRFIGILQR